MEIVYCDTCGFRVPEKAFAEGQALREGDRIFCEKCRPQPVRAGRAASSHEIRAQVPRRHTAPLLLPASRSRAPAESGAHQEPRSGGAQPEAKRSSVAVILLPAMGILLLGALILFVGSGKNPEPGHKSNSQPGSSATHSSSPARTIRETPRTAPAPHPGAGAAPSAQVPQANAGSPSLEKSAQDAFYALTRFEGLDKDDKAGRIERLEAYLEKHGEAIIAARAHALLSELKRASSAPDSDPAPIPQPASGVAVPALPQSGKAKFIRRDDTTSGNWKGVYGKDGYLLPAYLAPKEGDFKRGEFSLQALPSYLASIGRAGNFHPFCRNPKGDGARSLQHPTQESRCLAADVGSMFDYEISIQDGKPHRVALYFVNGDRTARSQSIQLLCGQALLDQQDLTAPSFDEGSYLIWEVEGKVLFRIANIKGASGAVCNGLFFDPVAAPVPEKTLTESPAPAVPSLPPALPAEWSKELALLLRQNRFSDAMDWLEKKLRQPESEDRAKALAQEKADLYSVLAVRLEAMEALHDRVGKDATLWRGATPINGQVCVNPNGPGISLKVSGGPEFSFRAESLAAQDADAYAPRSRKTKPAEEFKRRARPA